MASDFWELSDLAGEEDARRLLSLVSPDLAVEGLLVFLLFSDDRDLDLDFDLDLERDLDEALEALVLALDERLDDALVLASLEERLDEAFVLAFDDLRDDCLDSDLVVEALEVLRSSRVVPDLADETLDDFALVFLDPPGVSVLSESSCAEVGRLDLAEVDADPFREDFSLALDDLREDFALVLNPPSVE